MFKYLFPKIIFLLTIILSIHTNNASAQINTEKYRKYYTDETGFLFNLATTFALKAGNTEYSSYTGSGRIDYNGKKFDTFIVGNFEFKNTGETKVENDGFVHLRGIVHITNRTTWELFLQKQYDEFIDLDSRDLAGTGIKYRLIEAVSKKDSTNSVDVNISTGLMYEIESYNPDGGSIDLYNWRSTSFLSIDWLIKNKLNVTSVIYYQPSINNFKDYRIAADSGLEFAIAKSVKFIFSLTYRYNNLPVTDVKKFDFSIQNGIRIEIK